MKSSKKRQQEDAKYRKLRINFLEEKPMCEARLPGCTLKSTDVHHKYSGKDRSKYYLDTSTWLSCCRSCHDFIHKNPRFARESNLLF
ncbi:MAG: hypothetical protein HRT87_04550 [Legionellales bacterium]|nr:hypothetical protein [Legionellales bacterium]